MTVQKWPKIHKIRSGIKIQLILNNKKNVITLYKNNVFSSKTPKCFFLVVVSYYFSACTCACSSFSSTSFLFPSVFSSFSNFLSTSFSHVSTAFSASSNAWYSCRLRSRLLASCSKVSWFESNSAATPFSDLDPLSVMVREDWHRRSRDALWKERKDKGSSDLFVMDTQVYTWTHAQKESLISGTFSSHTGTQTVHMYLLISSSLWISSTRLSSSEQSGAADWLSPHRGASVFSLTSSCCSQSLSSTTRVSYLNKSKYTGFTSEYYQIWDTDLISIYSTVHGWLNRLLSHCTQTRQNKRFAIGYSRNILCQGSANLNLTWNLPIGRNYTFFSVTIPTESL